MTRAHGRPVGKAGRTRGGGFAAAARDTARGGPGEGPSATAGGAEPGAASAGQIADLAEAFPANNVGRAAGLPVWRGIERALREAIAARRVLPGQRLPTETQLAAAFDVHRHTIRRAIAPLVADGLISVRQGQGMTVRDQMIDYPVGQRTRFSEIIAAMALAPAGDILEMAAEPAPGEVARPLGIAEGAPVIRVEMLRWADGVPVSLASDYVSVERFPAFEAVMARAKSITAAMTELGAGDYQRARTTVFARMPTPQEADLLRQPPNQPVMCTDSVNVAGSDRHPVQFSRGRFASQRVQLVFDTGA